MTPPVFDDKKIIVIFVLGGPGAGKSRLFITNSMVFPQRRGQEKEHNVRSSFATSIFVISLVGILYRSAFGISQN